MRMMRVGFDFILGIPGDTHPALPVANKFTYYSSALCGLVCQKFSLDVAKFSFFGMKWASSWIFAATHLSPAISQIP